MVACAAGAGYFLLIFSLMFDCNSAALRKAESANALISYPTHKAQYQEITVN